MYLSLPIRPTTTSSASNGMPPQRSQNNHAVLPSRSPDRVQFGNTAQPTNARFADEQAAVLLNVILGESVSPALLPHVTLLLDRVAPVPKFPALQLTIGRELTEKELGLILKASEPIRVQAKKHDDLMAVLKEKPTPEYFAHLAQIFSGEDWQNLYKLLPEEGQKKKLVDVLLEKLIHPIMDSEQEIRSRKYNPDPSEVDDDLLLFALGSCSRVLGFKSSNLTGTLFAARKLKDGSQERWAWMKPALEEAMKGYLLQGVPKES
jgi:hypothetical protein